MSRRLIIIPRWSGTPASDWYPWLKRELERIEPRPFDPVVVKAMSDPGTPTIAAWVPEVQRALGDDPHQLAETVMIGHSVGCQAVLRALALLPDDVHVSGVMCVAGWFQTDAPWESLLPWIETPFDLGRARAGAGRNIVLLTSDNDPHTSDWQANQDSWRKKLDASPVLVPGAAHFNGSAYPAIVETLVERFTA